LGEVWCRRLPCLLADACLLEGTRDRMHVELKLSEKANWFEHRTTMKVEEFKLRQRGRSEQEMSG